MPIVGRAPPKSAPEGRRGYRFSGIDALVLQGGSSCWAKLDCMGWQEKDRTACEAKNLCFFLYLPGNRHLTKA